MSSNNAPPTEELLHAYADGVLPDFRRAEVEAYLDQNPQEARRIAAYREQNAALRELGALLAAQPVPLRPRRRSGLAPGMLLGQAVAAVMLVALGVAGGWWLRGRGDVAPLSVARPAFVQEAAEAHTVYVPEVLHPVEVTARQEQHLVTWLSKRLGTPVKAPHLGDLGYELVGGRLLPAAEGPAGQFMYQDGQGNRLTLYLVASRPQARETAFRYLRKGPVGVFYWVGGGMDYALAGELEKSRLLEVATAIYRQTDKL